MKYFLFIAALFAAQSQAYVAKGTSVDKDESLLNSYVSAHFQCNREGLWADLDSLQVVDVSTTQFVIAGGKKKMTQYIHRVKFECTEKYQKVPSEE